MTTIVDPSTALAKSAQAFQQIEPARASHAVAISKAENILQTVPADHPLAVAATELIEGRRQEVAHMVRIAELRKAQAELDVRFTIAMGELDARDPRK